MESTLGEGRAFFFTLPARAGSSPVLGGGTREVGSSPNVPSPGGGGAGSGRGNYGAHASGAAVNSSVPVLLTASEKEEHLIKGVRASCQQLLQPMHLDQIYQVLKSIEDFWFGSVKLPPR